MYDVIVVGGGPGGQEAAVYAAGLGLSVALVERDHLGGTCLNRGCIPTKTLLNSSHAYHSAAHTPGVTTSGLCLDFAELKANVDTVVSSLRSDIERGIAAAKIDLIRGDGRLLSAQKVEVQAAEGPVELEGNHIILACGSRPSSPPIPGADLEGVYNSDTLLAELPQAERLVVIGGGVIGLEFASFYAQTGCEVAILEMMPQVLPGMDKALAKGVVNALKGMKCSVQENAQVLAIEKSAGDDGALVVRYARKKKELSVAADAVLIATGRSANLEAIPADLGIAVERGRVVVDGQLKTSVKGVWAIGDMANAGPQLAHAASAQAIAAVCDIAGKPCGIDLSLVPGCVYTTPEIASVGLSLAEAQSQGIEAKSATYLTTGQGRTRAAGLGRGFITLVADAEDRIIGAQLLCGNATDIVGELTLAIVNKLTAAEAYRAIRPHPTFEEGVGEALKKLL